MKTTISTSDISHALKSDENAAWTWNGAKALAEYLEQLEEETGEEMELDVCAIRCDFSEYSSLEDWSAVYGMEDDSLDDAHEERADNIRSFIRDNGTLIEFDGGVIVSCF
jgi:hypothetical protein